MISIPWLRARAPPSLVYPVSQMLSSSSFSSASSSMHDSPYTLLSVPYEPRFRFERQAPRAPPLYTSARRHLGRISTLPSHFPLPVPPHVARAPLQTAPHVAKRPWSVRVRRYRWLSAARASQTLAAKAQTCLSAFASSRALVRTQTGHHLNLHANKGVSRENSFV